MKTYTKRQLHKARGIRTWYLRTYEDGRTTYTSLKTTSAKVAQEIVDRMNAARFFPDMAPAGMEQKTATDLRRASNEFLDGVSTLTPKSLPAYQTNLNWFLQYCEGEGITTMEQFTEAEATRLVEAMTRKFQPMTLHSRIATVRLLYRRTGQKQGRKLGDPFENVKLPKIERREKDFWTMEEIGRIVEATEDPRERMAYAFMGYAGLRIHEASKVEAKDIQGDELLVYGKGGKEARLPISPRLREEIDRYTAACGGHFEPTAMKRARSTTDLRRACRKAGVKEGNWCSNHKLRHSFASNLARSGCPEKVAQQLMRHSSYEMTMEVYSHILPEDMKDWAGRI